MRNPTRNIVPTLFVCAFLIAGATPAPAANPYYADCIACHALPVAQAEGLDRHGFNPQPPLGSLQEACFECHEWTEPSGHQGPPASPYYWMYPVGPTPPSAVTQMCTSCHAPYDPIQNHPNDHIPFLPVASDEAAPTSVLPLFEMNGLKNQDPNTGGVACATCHDPHDPSYPLLSSGRPSYLRIGDGSGDITDLCRYCHTFEGQTTGFDLVIGRSTDSVTFSTPDGLMMDVFVTVTNRGNAGYPGGLMTVELGDGSGAPPALLPDQAVPPLPPEGSVAIPFSWFQPVWEGDEAFIFTLDPYSPPSELNPGRDNRFVRSIPSPAPPENLQVLWTDSDSVDLAWEPPGGAPGPYYEYYVYRNGELASPYPVWGEYFTDTGLAPDTPHVYTVRTVSQEGFLSQESNRAGGATGPGLVIRVPEQYPTIQEAVQSASPGTTILVGPGTYAESFFVGQNQVTIKGQDAKGCILDLSGLPPVDLSYGTNTTLSGFTILDGQVITGPGSTITNCVFFGSPADSVYGAGFVNNCVFDGPVSGSAIRVPPGMSLAVGNSIFMQPNPIYYEGGASGDEFHNNFVADPWIDPQDPDGNYSAAPYFAPGTYIPEIGSPDIDRGLDVGLPFQWAAPDVGAFEAGFAYTPEPPGNLAAEWRPQEGRIALTWSLSPDDPELWLEYWVYRSDAPDFPPWDADTPIAQLPIGSGSFDDTSYFLDATYYYRVMAVNLSGPSPSGMPVVSAATNIASATPSLNPPTAVDDFYQADEGGTLDVPAPGVLGNDTDPDGDPLSALLVSGVSHGTLTLNPNGSFTYTHDGSGTPALDSFVYKADDGLHDSNFATVTIDIIPVNDPPVAVDDSYSVPEDQALFIPAPGVLGNDTDEEGDPLTAILVSGPASSLVFNFYPDGTFDYLPQPDYHGTDSFTYFAREGQDSRVATVTITVMPVNDPPTALDDTAEVDEDGEVYVDVFANDTDPDGDPLTMSSYYVGSHGQVVFLSGMLRYTPDADFHGTDSFSYTARDPGGATANPATVYVTVHPVNDPPAAADDAYAVGEDGTLTVPAPGLLGNDTDPDGDALMAGIGTAPQHGSRTINADGSLTYTPDAEFHGTDFFTYDASDGAAFDTATVTITVNPVNDAPVLGAIGDRSVAEGGSLRIDLSASDVDGDSLSFATTNRPSFCALGDNFDGTAWMDCLPRYDDEGTYSITVTASDNGAPILTDSETFTLTVGHTNRPPAPVNPGPQSSAEGDSVSLQVEATDPDGDALTYTAYDLPPGLVIDGGSGLISGTLSYNSAGSHYVSVTVSDGAAYVGVNFTWTVAETNRAPVAAGDAGGTDEDTPVTVDVLANDSDPDGDALGVTSVTQGASGSVAFTAADVTYTPSADFHGTDSFTYTVSDGRGGTATAAVSVTVATVNDAPVLGSIGARSVAEGSSLTVPLSAADADNGDDLSFSAADLPAFCALADSGDGTGTIDCAPSYFDAGLFTVTVTVQDDGTPTLTDSETFDLTVTDVSTMRVDSIATGEYTSKGKTTYTARVLVLDGGAAALQDAGITGHWVGTGVDVPAETLTTGPDGTATFETNGIKRPGGVYTFTVDDVVKAGYLYDIDGSVTSGQYPPPSEPSPPVAHDDSVSTATGEAVTIDVLANDTDPDGDVLTVTNLTQPAFGTAVLNPDQTVTYTPDGATTGDVVFTYTAHDGLADSNAATVTVTVTDTPAGGSMHVASIDVTAGGKKVVKAQAVVTVVDAAGLPVEGVTVTGDWSGAATGSSAGTTGADGTASLQSPGVKDASGQTFTFTVTGLARDGWTYDAAANVETSDSVTAP